MRRLTLAGHSNNAPFAAEIYEHLWRPRALSLLTGEPFSEERELDLLGNWARIRPGDRVVDVGTSTGLLARGLAEAAGGDVSILALDQAPRMLACAQREARREGLKNITFVRGMAEALPVAESSVDVVVCGGSLNEFRSATDALREMRRVLKPDGRIVTTSLLAAERRRGKLAQAFFGLSGIRFPTLGEFNACVREAGLTIVKQQVRGVVAFSLIEKQE